MFTFWHPSLNNIILSHLKPLNSFGCFPMFRPRTFRSLAAWRFVKMPRQPPGVSHQSRSGRDIAALGAASGIVRGMAAVSRNPQPNMGYISIYAAKMETLVGTCVMELWARKKGEAETWKLRQELVSLHFPSRNHLKSAGCPASMSVYTLQQGRHSTQEKNWIAPKSTQRQTILRNSGPVTYLMAVDISPLYGLTINGWWWWRTWPASPGNCINCIFKEVSTL